MSTSKVVSLVIHRLPTCLEIRDKILQVCHFFAISGKVIFFQYNVITYCAVPEDVHTPPPPTSQLPSPPWKGMEISGGGGGGSKAKTFEGKYEATLEFPEGVVSLRKSLLWGVGGGVDIF